MKKSLDRKQKKAKTDTVEAVIATMSPEDVASLRQRYDTWAGQQRVAEQLFESYRMQAMSLQERYVLPPQYIVDFETGAVTLPEPTPALVQETVTAHVPAGREAAV